MRVIRPLQKSDTLRNAIFLAGPTPRVGIKYKDDCQWRQQAINLFKMKGFNGDLIDPINRSFNQHDMIEQINWQREYLYKSSLVFFWIPRSEQHPAFTTNVQFGTWLGSQSIVLGFPENSIKNDYLKYRYEIDNGKIAFNNLQQMVDYSINYLQNKKQNVFFTSDTHFSAERTLQLSRRPFRNVKDMDLTLISNWNKKVTMNDIVYHLGDFGNQEIVKELNFKKMYFVCGNYENKSGYKILEKDPRVTILKEEINPFDGSVKFPNFFDAQKSQDYNLIHQPLHELSLANDDDFYLFGHIHRLQLIKRNGINVGTDCHRFTPVSLDDIRFLRNGMEKYFDQNVFTDIVM